MITISVDEAAAFDMYSILRVKLSKVVSEGTLKSVHLMQTEIKLALGADLFARVLDSEQYGHLIDTNAKLFDLIDEIKRRGPTVDDARQIDNLNYERYKGKAAIQSTFFVTALTETKIGYDKVNQSLTSGAKQDRLSS